MKTKLQNRIITVLLALITVPFFTLNAQALHGLWTIGTAAVETGRSVQITPDGDYIVAGNSTSLRAVESKVYVTLSDANGNFISGRTFGGDKSDFGLSVTLPDKEGYAVAGYSNSFSNEGDNDVYVIKFGPKNDVQWSRLIGAGNDDRGFSIVKGAKGGYVVAGYTTSFGAGGRDVYVVRLDEKGNVEWARTYGGKADDVGLSIKQVIHKNEAAGFIVVGYTQSFGMGKSDVYVVRLDENGKLMWTRTIGNANDDIGFDIYQTRKGDFLITGTTVGEKDQLGEVYIVRLNPDGALLWTKTVGGGQNDIGYSIIETWDDGFAVAGMTESFSYGKTDVYFIKFDAKGNLDWARSIGSKEDEIAYSIKQTDDKGYIVAGFTTSFGYGSQDVFLIKYDVDGNTCYKQMNGGKVGEGGKVSEGGVMGEGYGVKEGVKESRQGDLFDICTTTSVNPLSATELITVYPNPASEVLYINGEALIQNISIYSREGRRVYSVADVQSNKTTLKLDAYSDGIYLIRIETDEGVINRKFVVRK